MLYVKDSVNPAIDIGCSRGVANKASELCRLCAGIMGARGGVGVGVGGEGRDLSGR